MIDTLISLFVFVYCLLIPAVGITILYWLFSYII